MCSQEFSTFVGQQRKENSKQQLWIFLLLIVFFSMSNLVKKSSTLGTLWKVQHLQTFKPTVLKIYCAVFTFIPSLPLKGHLRRNFTSCFFFFLTSFLAQRSTFTSFCRQSKPQTNETNKKNLFQTRNQLDSIKKNCSPVYCARKRCRRAIKIITNGISLYRKLSRGVLTFLRA